MLGAAQDIEQAKREADVAPPQPWNVRRAVARAWHGVAGVLIPDPASASVRYEDLRVGETVGLAASLAPIALACGTGAGDDLGPDRPPLRVVAVEQDRRGGTLQDQCKFPR